MEPATFRQHTNTERVDNRLENSRTVTTKKKATTEIRWPLHTAFRRFRSFSDMLSKSNFETIISDVRFEVPVEVIMKIFISQDIMSCSPFKCDRCFHLQGETELEHMQLLTGNTICSIQSLWSIQSYRVAVRKSTSSVAAFQSITMITVEYRWYSAWIQMLQTFS